MPNDVTVFGSLSMDIVIRVPRLPSRGETLIGSSFDTFPGGKGNNQAMAAARAGASVAMVGRVGNDPYGRVLIETLSAEGVNTSELIADKNQTTGIANIWVGPSGENSIVIVSNANFAMSADIAVQTDFVASSKVLLLQLEIPIAAVIAAAKRARENGAIVILNPAPAPDAGLPAELLEHVDILVPNETEAHLLSGINPDSQQTALQCAQKLLAMGPRAIILTLGERGAYILEKDQGEAKTVDAFKVVVVDTTAAGDAFCGALAARLSRGNTLIEAARYGCAAGSLACTKAGAIPSLPRLDELESLVKQSV